MLLGVSEARAGWVQPAGAYDLHGQKPELPSSYRDSALNYYVEYGVTSETTVIVHGAVLGFSAIGDASTMYSGLNLFGLRFALLKDAIPVAFELSYGYSPPLGNKPLTEGTVDGMRFLYRPTFEQQLGRGELSAGWS